VLSLRSCARTGEFRSLRQNGLRTDSPWDFSEKTGRYVIAVSAWKSKLHQARLVEGLFSLCTSPPKVLQTGTQLHQTLAGSFLVRNRPIKVNRPNERIHRSWENNTTIVRRFQLKNDQNNQKQSRRPQIEASYAHHVLTFDRIDDSWRSTRKVRTCRPWRHELNHCFQETYVTRSTSPASLAHAASS
jgi:hypothetical protein